VLNHVSTCNVQGSDHQYSSNCRRLGAPYFKASCTLQVSAGAFSFQLGDIVGERFAPSAEWGRQSELGARVVVEYCRRSKVSKLELIRSRSATVMTGSWHRRRSLSIDEVLFTSDLHQQPETKVLKLLLQPSATFFRFKDPASAHLRSTSKDHSHYAEFSAFEVDVILEPSRRSVASVRK
jgi:hypothetical protein